MRIAACLLLLLLLSPAVRADDEKEVRVPDDEVEALRLELVKRFLAQTKVDAAWTIAFTPGEGDDQAPTRLRFEMTVRPGRRAIQLARADGAYPEVSMGGAIEEDWAYLDSGEGVIRFPGTKATGDCWREVRAALVRVALDAGFELAEKDGEAPDPGSVGFTIDEAEDDKIAFRFQATNDGDEGAPWLAAQYFDGKAVYRRGTDVLLRGARLEVRIDARTGLMRDGWVRKATVASVTRFERVPTTTDEATWDARIRSLAARSDAAAGAVFTRGIWAGVTLMMVLSAASEAPDEKAGEAFTRRAIDATIPMLLDFSGGAAEVDREIGEDPTGDLRTGVVWSLRSRWTTETVRWIEALYASAADNDPPPDEEWFRESGVWMERLSRMCDDAIGDYATKTVEQRWPKDAKPK